jgi:putative transposase
MATGVGMLEKIYKNESDVKVKERLLLILKVKGDEMVPAHAAKELHRSRTWASDWLKRYREEGVDGLKNRPISGRPSELPEEVALKIQRKLKESKQGWTTKQVYEMILKVGGIRYHYFHIYRILHKWGFRQKVPRKVHVNTAPREEKDSFKKEPERYWTLFTKQEEKDLQ